MSRPPLRVTRARDVEAFAQAAVEGSGCTKVELFAALATAGLLANPQYDGATVEEIARHAALAAQALADTLDGAVPAPEPQPERKKKS